MACDCIPRLTTSLRSGSYNKKAKVIAILGMLSMCCQSGPKTNQPCTPHDALLLCTAALPEVITVISRAGEPCCTCVVALTVPCNNVSCFTLTAYTDLLSCYRQDHMPGRLPSRLQMLPHTLHTSAQFARCKQLANTAHGAVDCTWHDALGASIFKSCT